MGTFTYIMFLAIPLKHFPIELKLKGGGRKGYRASIHPSQDPYRRPYGFGTVQGPRMLGRQAYCRVLERPADSGGLQSNVQLLSGGYDEFTLMHNLVLSEEHNNRFVIPSTPEQIVTKLYDHLLARGPDPTGFRGWVDHVKRYGAEETAKGIMGSQEYLTAFGNHTIPEEEGRVVTNSTRASRGRVPGSAAHNAVGLAGESPVVGID